MWTRPYSTKQNSPASNRPTAASTERTGPENAPRETQAHKFMGYLLMPAPLVRDAVAGVDLMQWPELYRLRDLFRVTISALTIRLEQLGRLYVDPNGTLHPSRAESQGQTRLGG